MIGGREVGVSNLCPMEGDDVFKATLDLDSEILAFCVCRGDSKRGRLLMEKSKLNVFKITILLAVIPSSHTLSINATH